MMSISPLCLALKPINNGLTCFLLINTFMLATSAPGTERTDQLVVRSAPCQERTLLTAFCANQAGQSNNLSSAS